MTTDTRVLTRPGPWSRIAGLGTIYGKTVRDSWRAALVIGGVASLFMIGTGAPYGFAPEFSTIALRQAFIDGLTALPPALRGLLGEPINLTTMGGFLSWRVGNFLPVMLGLWPVIALSGTIAGEAAKGSLDLLASTPQARRTIAIEKLAGHITAVIFAMLLLAATIWMVGTVFAKLPGDEIPVSAALGQVALYGVMMLFVGGVAFATGPWVGRTRAMAFGLIVLFASYLIYAYATLSPVVDALKPLSFFTWTEGHRPMAGVSDWPSVIALAAVDGRALRDRRASAFVRRDLGGLANVGWIRLPSLPAGIAGPFTRQLADRAGVALGVGPRHRTVRRADRGLGRRVLRHDQEPAADRSPHRGGLPGPRPHPAVGRPPADVLQLRLVHHRPFRSDVPRGLGRATRAGVAWRSSCPTRRRGPSGRSGVDSGCWRRSAS